MTSRPRASQEDAGGEQQQQRKSKRRRSGPQQSEKKDQAMELEEEAQLGASLNRSVPSYIGHRGLINRNEYLRLLQQSLAQLGFSDIAEQLENRSGVPRQSSTTSNLTECVLNGDWTGALEAVRSLDLVSKTAALVLFLIFEQKFLEILENGDELAAIKCLRNDLAPLAINTERLHELSRKLATSKQTPALPSASAPSSAAPGSIEKITAGRRKLLASLQNIVPAGTLLPEGRLEELIEQALAAQIERCQLHNSLHPHISLLQNYSCGKEQLPLNCSQILKAHTSEVWHLKFSHNGKMLATCGRDNKVILWDVDDVDNKKEEGSGSGSCEVRMRLILSAHTAPVLFVAWSPDDSILASCGQDSKVCLWDPTASSVHSSSPIRILQHHCEPVLSASWLPDNKTLVTAGQDRMVSVVGVDGEVCQHWRAHRMQDVSVTAGGKYILASTHDRRINVYEALLRPKHIMEQDAKEDQEEKERGGGYVHVGGGIGGSGSGSKEETESFEQQRQLAEKITELVGSTAHSKSDWLFTGLFDSKKQRDSTILEGEDLMAFSTSPCGRYLLANLRDGTLSLWDLGSRCHRTLKTPVGLVGRFTPPGNPEGSLGRFVVRSCLGGVGAKFITTGTESGKVPVWQRDTGELLAVLEGHTGVVNAVAWNPKHPEMMASASDDGTVRIWKAS